MSDVEEIKVAPRHFVGIRREVPTTELAGFFAEVFPKVMQWMGEKGIPPASAPMAVWCAMDMETGIADTHAGAFVAQPVEGEGEITPGITVGGDALKLVHVGGYDKMGQSWGRIYRRAKELGRVPGSGWEVYVDDPQTVPADELKTEIYLPIE